MKKFIIISLTCVLAGCGTSAPRYNTAIGKPEKMYPGATLEAVSTALTTRCNKNGAQSRVSDNEVICEKPLEIRNAALKQIVLGKNPSATPVTVLRYRLGQQPDGVKVSADMWAETKMPDGQVDTIPTDSNEVRKMLQDGLDGLDVQKK